MENNMKKNNTFKSLYMAAVLGICLVPSVGMLFGNSEENVSLENRKLAQKPSLREEDGGWNREWLSQAGDYFQDHFAFRSELVTANAKIRSRFFGVSADQGVIDGSNGWLYYTDSLEDYLGSDLMGDRGIFNVAHSMALMQEAVRNSGADFLYAPVPNKNTLYGENMPYYFRYKVSEEKNLEKLYAMLEEEGVNYVNLLEKIGKSDNILYHKTDSHWTNQGAALAGECILDGLKREYVSYENEPYEVREDFLGDLEGMLFPAAAEPDEEIYYERVHEYEYEGEVGSNFDPKINTFHQAGSGNLVMYRDSFGNALLPYLADSFETAYFSRSVPYPMIGDLLIHQPDTVIVERAERFLHDTAKNPPVMTGLIRNPMMDTIQFAGNAELITGEECAAMDLEKIEKLSLILDGTNLRLDGIFAKDVLENKSRILIQIDEGMFYEAFPATILSEGNENENGFRLYFQGNADLERETPQKHQVQIYIGTEIQEALPEEPQANIDSLEFEMPQMEMLG